MFKKLYNGTYELVFDLVSPLTIVAFIDDDEMPVFLNKCDISISDVVGHSAEEFNVDNKFLHVELQNNGARLCVKTVSSDNSFWAGTEISGDTPDTLNGLESILKENYFINEKIELVVFGVNKAEEAFLMSKSTVNERYGNY